MKKISLILLALVMLSVACKDSKKGTAGNETAEKKELSPEAEHDLQLFRRSIKMGDVTTALSAANSYILRDTLADNYGIKDTLVKIYLQMGSGEAAFILAKELVEKKPNDTAMLEIYLGVADQLGLLGKSIDKAKQLVDMRPDLPEYQFLYATALVQNNSIQEAVAVLEKVANDPQPNQTHPTHDVVMGDKVDRVTTNAKIAALMNLARLYKAMNNKKQAEDYYRKVLQEDPKFNFATQEYIQMTRG